MKWWIKAFTQSILAHLPMGPRLHERLQLKYGELAKFEDSSRFKNAIFFLKQVRENLGFDREVRAVEIGTGWVPAVPMALLLSGVRVETFDITRLVRPDILSRCMRETGQKLSGYADAGGLPLEELQRRFDQVKDQADFSAVARALGGRYAAPFDTTHLPYKAGEIDFVFSNLVFQNVHAQILNALVHEIWRVLKPGGVAVHRIGMQDEYAAVDPNRGSVDFLRYSRSGWDFFCSHSIKYCNRLRCSQFIDIFEKAGFKIKSSAKVVDWKMIPRLQQRGVASEFRNLGWIDLATTGLEVVLEKPSDRAASIPGREFQGQSTIAHGRQSHLLAAGR